MADLHGCPADTRNGFPEIDDPCCVHTEPVLVLALPVQGGLPDPDTAVRSDLVAVAALVPV